MATQNFLIMNLLRIITPEEIADIATKHNGGKFLSLTELVTERIERNIFRDFSNPMALDEIHEDQVNQAKILPFKKEDSIENLENENKEEVESGAPETERAIKLKPAMKKLITTSQVKVQEEEEEVVVSHKENENMSSFILVEKARLKKSQKVLKQKEIIDLYQKNSHVDVEQIKNTNANPAASSEAGVLVNKKQF